MVMTPLELVVAKSCSFGTSNGGEEEAVEERFSITRGLGEGDGLGEGFRAGEGVGEVFEEAEETDSKIDSFVRAVFGTINGGASPCDTTTPPSLGRTVITETCVPALRVSEPAVFPSTTTGTV